MQSAVFSVHSCLYLNQAIADLAVIVFVISKRHDDPSFAPKPG